MEERRSLEPNVTGSNPVSPATRWRVNSCVCNAKPSEWGINPGWFQWDPGYYNWEIRHNAVMARMKWFLAMDTCKTKFHDANL